MTRHQPSCHADNGTTLSRILLPQIAASVGICKIHFAHLRLRLPYLPKVVVGGASTLVSPEQLLKPCVCRTYRATGMVWSLRVRHTNGQSTIAGAHYLNIRHRRGDQRSSACEGLEPSTSLQSLLVRVSELCGIPADRQELLLGFPPKPLPVLSNDRGSQRSCPDQAFPQAAGNPSIDSLSSLGITNGDTIVVREAAQSCCTTAPRHEDRHDAGTSQQPSQVPCRARSTLQ